MKIKHKLYKEGKVFKEGVVQIRLIDCPYNKGEINLQTYDNEGNEIGCGLVLTIKDNKLQLLDGLGEEAGFKTDAYGVPKVVEYGG